MRPGGDTEMCCVLKQTQAAKTHLQHSGLQCDTGGHVAIPIKAGFEAI